MLENKKGITLVALIVTIIILLILAGVTIAQLTENGLFEKAKKAGKESENAQIKEKGILADYEEKIDEYVNGTREQILVDKQEYEQLKSNVTNLQESQQELLKKMETIENNNEELAIIKGKYEEVIESINDLKDKAEYTEIEINSPSEKKAWVKVADYPSGYTYDNCYIKCAWIERTNSNPHKIVIPTSISGWLVMLRTNQNGIEMYIGGDTDSAIDLLLNKPVKIYLEKE